MNIRKFIGASNRDALRLVREALGDDAVVLSNRTLDDGSVEIAALADAELAAIAPPAAAPGAGAAPSAFASAPAPAPARAGTHPGINPGLNPYASGDLPDVFSSVFGARADTADGADATFGVASAPAASASAPASAASSAASASRAALQTASQAASQVASPVAMQTASPAAASEPAPWLVEHAKRLTKQRDALARPPAPAQSAERASAASPDWARDVVRNVASRLPATDAAPAARRAGDAQPAPAPRAALDVAAAVADAMKRHVERIVDETVMHELGTLRGMLEEQFDGLMWRERQRRSAVHSALTKHLFAAGFSAQLVRMVVDNLPDGDEAATLDRAIDWAQTVLAANLPVLESEDALMERGGVFALMGPTGAGKTTTTAKLAARCVMRFGASKVALLTTDSYRIGGHEQLRIFGKILGVPVHAVKDAGDLQFTLSELRNKHIVLIDTIGMSQRDRAVSDQIAMLHGADTPVQRLLLLNATSHGDTLNEVVQAYRGGDDRPELAGCVLTKLDEATNLGGTLDAVIRYRLPVHYVSTGQKVPENLYVATKKFLVKSAFCVPRAGSPFVPQDDDVPGMLAALAVRSPADPHEVRFG
ncbi:flagellar biosynthesis protein FlhF [Burkholderia guangdongensis]|uniref:flagellar biosynthesis protein FlhF n=1 Tax=Burkholderia guangdongensis TaxID=1792500 RepID=UPI0015CB1B74|nr:flagellar biosynthesis protein FlhF [Burkholderia guangdongensis]